MNVELITRPPVTVAYLRYTGPFGAPVGAFWNTQVAPWITAHNLWSHPRYGISHDDPSITAPEQSRYDACVEVPEDFVPDGGFLKTVLPGGRYAAMKFHACRRKSTAPGRACCATGCRPAASSSTTGSRSNTTRRAAPSTRRPAPSNATSAFRSRRFEEAPGGRLTGPGQAFVAGRALRGRRLR